MPRGEGAEGAQGGCAREGHHLPLRQRWDLVALSSHVSLMPIFPARWYLASALLLPLLSAFPSLWRP